VPQTKQDLLRDARKAIELCERRIESLKELEQSADAQYATSRSDADGTKADRKMTKRMELQARVHELRQSASLLESDIAEGKLGWDEGRITGEAYAHQISRAR
jgi:hypothetical protein